MRIAVLSNHLNALPSLEFLHKQGLLAGIGVSDLKREACLRMKAIAAAHKIPFTVISSKRKTEQITAWIEELKADVVFVVMFTYKIEPELLKLPPHGFINFHPGILPGYRGPVPSFWELRAREPFGGVTAHLMNADYDAGPIAHIEKVPIAPQDTYGAFMNKIAFATLAAVRVMLEKLANPEALKYAEQDELVANYKCAPDGHDLLIDWNKMSGDDIGALVRAANPFWGGAIAFLRGQPMRVLEVAQSPRPAGRDVKPGTILTASPADGITVATHDGRSLRLNLLSVHEGFYSARRLVETFGIKPGESFANPA